jgi:hypothetical protein
MNLHSEPPGCLIIILWPFILLDKLWRWKTGRGKQSPSS